MRQLIVYIWVEFSEIGIIFGISREVNTKLFIQISKGDNIQWALISGDGKIIYVLFIFLILVGNHAMIGFNCGINVTFL